MNNAGNIAFATQNDSNQKEIITTKEVEYLESIANNTELKYYDYYEIRLETGFQRVAYYFELDDGDEKSYYYGDCFSKTPDAERYEYFQLPFNLILPFSSYN